MLILTHSSTKLRDLRGLRVNLLSKKSSFSCPLQLAASVLSFCYQWLHESFCPLRLLVVSVPDEFGILQLHPCTLSKCDKYIHIFRQILSITSKKINTRKTPPDLHVMFQMHFNPSSLFFHEILYSFYFLRNSNCQILLTHLKIEGQEKKCTNNIWNQCSLPREEERRISIHIVFMQIQPLNENFHLPTWYLHFLF